MRKIYFGILFLSASTLAFELILTRVFAVAQWYHFAFMAVSVALLGLGASGTALALFPRVLNPPTAGRLAAVSLLFSVTLLGSYLVVNYLPFDSYRIAWERRQLIYLAVYYLALATPFFFSGLLIGGLLSAWPAHASTLYAFNLAGSGLGCLLAIAGLSTVGPAGAVLLAAALGMGSAALLALSANLPISNLQYPHPRSPQVAVLIVSTLLLAALALRPPAWLDVRMSPYKTLSTVLRFPDTRLTSTAWNAYSRVDTVESSAIRSAPGLSFTYKGPMPRQAGLTVDGDDLSPITGETPESATFTDDLPVALPYDLRPGARALIINPRGGLDVLTALRHGASSVTVVEDNPLTLSAVRDRYAGFTRGLYRDPRVTLVVENGRSYARRPGPAFDLIHLSLSDSFKVVNFGAYSLTEDYLHTVEAFGDLYRRLADNGLLVAPRWLQLPPSEELRTAGIALEALRRLGVERPDEQLAAYRSFQTMTLLVRRGPFTQAELAAIRSFCASRHFDLVYLPGMAPEEANRYNVLKEPSYYLAFQQLLGPDAETFVANYPYDIRPPTDDRPFFFHFFRWSQVPAILQTFGQTWQPFGGSGYLVLVLLLALALVTSLALILAPLRFLPPVAGRSQFPTFAYFGALGIGFLFLEIPLMQRFILFLGHPTYSFGAVLFGILVFSGLGSNLAPRVPWPAGLLALILVSALYPFVLPLLLAPLLGFNLPVRLAVTLITLAPLGLLMGMPFPRGIQSLEKKAPGLIPWAWGINGCTSVISAILAAMGAVSFGLSVVLAAGCAAYFIAWLTARTAFKPEIPSPRSEVGGRKPCPLGIIVRYVRSTRSASAPSHPRLHTVPRGSGARDGFPHPPAQPNTSEWCHRRRPSQPRRRRPTMSRVHARSPVRASSVHSRRCTPSARWLGCPVRREKHGPDEARAGTSWAASSHRSGCQWVGRRHRRQPDRSAGPDTRPGRIARSGALCPS